MLFTRNNCAVCTHHLFSAALPCPSRSPFVRFCVGYSLAMAEMKVFLALLARGYELSADFDTEWVQQLGKVPANGLPMRVVRRRVCL